MPEAVMFQYEQKLFTVTFAQTNAVLPVRLKGGAIKLVTWGRRARENSEMPLGGWARLPTLQDLQHSRWHLYLPKPVCIPVNKFMEKNFEGNSCWYELTKGQYLQGVLAREKNEYRVYIVTIDPEDFMNTHYRWPNIITQIVRT